MFPETITEEGIYFGLPAANYHRSPWLGSTNIKQLFCSPPDYWFNSHMNPLREPEEETFAKSFGSALHDRILYGEDYFRKHYVRLDGGTKTGEVSADAVKEWIAEQGGKPAKTKEENARIAKEEFNVTLVAEKTFAKIMVSAAMIVKNPHLASAFINGWPEISVFWHQDGIPCKARFDYLKSRVIVDLKSFRSKERLMRVNSMFISDMKKYLYSIQACHYMAGHQAALELVKAGKVFVNGATPCPTTEWLTQCFSQLPGFVFVAYKADSMPTSRSYQIPFNSAWHEAGKWRVKEALQNYRDYMEKFGPNDAWVDGSEPYTLDEDDFKFAD